MALVELRMPKMGESIMEATILGWSKNVGDSVEEDETILEIATDKVDSEVPSPTDGVIQEIKFQKDDVVPVGEIIAIIATEGENGAAPTSNDNIEVPKATPAKPQDVIKEVPQPAAANEVQATRFYSPLVRNIAKEENISMTELEAISGSGLNGRVTKKDILAYIANRSSTPQSLATPQPAAKSQPQTVAAPQFKTPPVDKSGNIEIIEMDRMRRLIADHMVMSKHVSPHVTSFVEADVTDIVNWRNNIKKDFQNQHGEKITFTPIFIEAVVKAIQDFPLVNIAVDGNNIVRYKDINVGMATALPSGNLIVPVIKNAQELNLIGLTKRVNDLANRARNNKLKPEDIQGGTFTLTNVGTFGNVMGTPIINQPQVAILATGAIRKVPAVLETEYGDIIAVRQKMFLSLSYDHRVVDGALGGSFLKRIADYLEAFDKNRTL